jgi:short-subunit dehydrogenase involved in D-alanine esterification of teichoic acids
MKGLAHDVLEIGYGTTEGILKASRAELDTAFQRMNSRW